MNPRLCYSPLGHRVYIVTRYRTDTAGYLVASRKYDVTDDVPRVIAAFQREERRRKGAHNKTIKGSYRCHRHTSLKAI